MNPSRLLIIAGVSFGFLTHSASAQTTAAKLKAPPRNVTSRNNSDAKAEADRIRKGRQSQARSLLFSLGSEARSFRDLKLRSRSLARIADALWDVDSEQGRTVFREAWEAAETADRESQKRLNLRGEVLKLVARRDHLLGEEFLGKLKPSQDEAEAELLKVNLWDLPEAGEKRLSLAENLLSTGDTERALQFADPVLNIVTISTVDFLSQLREKFPTAADQRYAAMLANTGSNMQADANTISLLSSYIFTPRMYVLFNNAGGADTSSMATLFPAANVAPQLQQAFFQTASVVLLRPQPPPEQDQGALGIAGKYMVIRRLLPLFEQFAPKETTAAMRVQVEALSALVSDSVRQSDNEWIQKGISPEKQLHADQEKALLDRIERAKTGDERDELYFQLALLALGKDDLKAREHVNKIDESGFRKRAQAWVDAYLAINAIKQKKTERVLELARSGELTQIQRVWLLAQAAKLLAKTDRDKALSLLDDATTEARRIEGSDLDRPRGLLAIASALILIEPSRAWDAVFDAVKAANATEGFTGEDGVLRMRINSKSRISSKTESVADFDVGGIFGMLANSDDDRAIGLARGFQGEAPRANATIAIARAMLDEKSIPVPKPRPDAKK
jgi:hypothetical protein